MRSRNAEIIALLISWTTAASAHEGGRHAKLMGTVQTIDEHRMVVKTTDGDGKAVGLDDQTKCAQDKRESTCSTIKPGDRVVVRTRGDEGATIADEIKFSSERK